MTPARRWGLYGAAVVLAVTLGAGIVVLPSVAVPVAAAAGAVAAMIRLPHRWLIAGLIAYLPLEGLVLTWIPPGSTAAVRYLPEVLLWVAAAGLLAHRGWPGLGRMRPLLAALALLAALWSVSAMINGTRPPPPSSDFAASFGSCPSR